MWFLRVSLTQIFDALKSPLPFTLLNRCDLFSVCATSFLLEVSKNFWLGKA